mmetsp:Transcript_30522/g.87538  ORF Transcript_30522/g.87538 Transcript_30522/m.87538 type:complete len:95 (-) Transcript_30522:97-381(-)
MACPVQLLHVDYPKMACPNSSAARCAWMSGGDACVTFVPDLDLAQGCDFLLVLGPAPDQECACVFSKARMFHGNLSPHDHAGQWWILAVPVAVS